MQIAQALFYGVLGVVALSPGDQQNPTIRADVNLVQLDARVTDSQGHIVPGLTKEAFQLFVDEVPTPITVFQGEDAPVTAGIVIDNSASMAPKRAEVIAAALAFARASNPRDQMFVVHFNKVPRFGLPEGKPFTGDIAELEAAISRFELGGTTAIYDALMLAQSQFSRAAYSRKVILLITDGGDNSSRATVEEVLNAALKAGVVIYSMGLYDETDRDRNPRVLTQLAEVTGGEAFFPAAIADTKKVCEQIAADIRAQYTLGFPGAEDGRYHRIRVTASDPKRGKLEVHTRAGYFAVKPERRSEIQVQRQPQRVDMARRRLAVVLP
jgi:VWFA-related protein